VSVYDVLKSLDIVLPEVEPPVAAFLPFLRSGNHVYLSGHIARVNGAPRIGKLGAGLTTEEGKSAARDVAIELLGTLHAAVGDLNRVSHIVKLMVLVNSDPSFTEQSMVANGASELFIKVFGEKGTHARSAFGVAQIPTGACVEIELIAEVA
jgi:enamine deaminase RidA (YjgF/YER057c/UK114 family)